VRDLYDGPAEGLPRCSRNGLDVSVPVDAKFENVRKRHLVAFVRMPSDFSLALASARCSQLKERQTVFKRFWNSMEALKRLPAASLSTRARRMLIKTRNGGSWARRGDRRPRAVTWRKYQGCWRREFHYPHHAANSSLVNPRHRESIRLIPVGLLHTVELGRPKEITALICKSR